jgi:type II secretory pathway predicted ATPase ExeA
MPTKTAPAKKASRRSIRTAQRPRPTQGENDFTRAQLNSLGLIEHPFRISADPRFLYLTDAHQWILQHLEKSIEWREGLSVIEGPIGSGKTILARRLFEIGVQKSSMELVYIHTASYKSNLGALRDIAGSFRLRPRQAKVDQLKDFEALLLDKRSKEINPVVIIDDAQFISTEGITAFQDLLNFDVSSKLLQIVLFGQSEVHHTFSKVPSLLDRVVFWHKLPPLTNQEVLNMISFRVSVAGRKSPLFTERALEMLLTISSGVPRPIIIVCNEAMKVILDLGRTEIDAPDMQRAIDIYNQRLV